MSMMTIMIVCYEYDDYYDVNVLCSMMTIVMSMMTIIVSVL